MHFYDTPLIQLTQQPLRVHAHHCACLQVRAGMTHFRTAPGLSQSKSRGCYPDLKRPTLGIHPDTPAKGIVAYMKRLAQ